jgi:hypothetical protein
MAALEILLPVIGVAVLAGVGADVFMTVLNPAVYGGPLTRWLCQLIWAVFRRLSRGRQGPRRHRALAVAAPAMAVTTVVVWLMLLIVGFALIYLPWMDTFIVAEGRLRTPWVEAFYFSASTATTLSIGDLIPTSEPLRILVPLETLAGVGILTAVLQYIMAISQHAQETATLALDIAMHFDREHTPELVAEQAQRDEDAGMWGEWCDGVSRSLLALWQALTRYPILNYFHPPTLPEALPVQLGCLLRLRRTALRAPSPLARHPGFVAMCRSLELYLTSIERHFLPAVDATRPGGRDLESAYRRLLQHTAYAAEVRDMAADEAGSPSARAGE